ncbi:hypothetical protein ED28_02705 [[Pantoea] beijingensis]|uniref:Flagellar hook-length control protein-like C-terminal domain-containing protein n=1 Tax=[Pantoea] beijingensis TaxID=1324864 RepID=A0A443IIM1_9GAMM|nr:MULTISPECIES: flagellar hook-length control protein FliK [Erwiniaceae]RWR03917.1 hypothetical protein ED28_02705 [[Pantoea] beijingensis]
MITLPTLPTSATLPVSFDDSVASNTSTAEDGIEQAFFTLISDHLTAKVNSAADDHSAVTPVNGERKAAPGAKLSTRSAGNEKPEVLTTLLHVENRQSVNKAADEKETLEHSALNESDKQALQALFAMLPPVTTNPLATLQKSTQKSSNVAQPIPEGRSVPPLVTQGSITSPDGVSGNSNNPTPPEAFFAAASAGNPSPTAPNLSASIISAPIQQAMSDSTRHNGDTPLAIKSDDTLNVNIPTAASSPLIPSTGTTTMAPATTSLNVQLGSPEWQQALGQHIVMFSRNGQQNAELKLHPQDLGTLQISLKLDNDQAQLTLVSGHSHVRAALEAAMPQLRSALAENGITLGQSNVSSESFPQHQSFSEQQQSPRESPHNGAVHMINDDEITAVAVPVSLQARIAGDRAVDIFA